MSTVMIKGAEYTTQVVVRDSYSPLGFIIVDSETGQGYVPECRRSHAHIPESRREQAAANDRCGQYWHAIDARCELPRGHDGTHRWPRGDGPLPLIVSRAVAQCREARKYFASLNLEDHGKLACDAAADRMRESYLRLFAACEAVAEAGKETAR